MLNKHYFSNEVNWKSLTELIISRSQIPSFESLPSARSRAITKRLVQKQKGFINNSYFEKEIVSAPVSDTIKIQMKMKQQLLSIAGVVFVQSVVEAQENKKTNQEIRILCISKEGWFHIICIFRNQNLERICIFLIKNPLLYRSKEQARMGIGEREMRKFHRFMIELVNKATPYSDCQEIVEKKRTIIQEVKENLTRQLSESLTRQMSESDQRSTASTIFQPPVLKELPTVIEGFHQDDEEKQNAQQPVKIPKLTRNPTYRKFEKQSSKAFTPLSLQKTKEKEKDSTAEQTLMIRPILGSGRKLEEIVAKSKQFRLKQYLQLEPLPSCFLKSSYKDGLLTCRSQFYVKNFLEESKKKVVKKKKSAKSGIDYTSQLIRLLKKKQVVK